MKRLQIYAAAKRAKMDGAYDVRQWLEARRWWVKNGYWGNKTELKMDHCVYELFMVIAGLHKRIANNTQDIELARAALERYGFDDPACIRKADQHLRHALGLPTSPDPLENIPPVSIAKVASGPDRDFSFSGNRRNVRNE